MPQSELGKIAKSAKIVGKVPFHDPLHGSALLPEAELQIVDTYNRLGGSATLGEPVRKEDWIWTFGTSSCICYNGQLKKAFEVHGAIYEQWIGVGREKSYLGLPTSDEVDFPEGGRASDFQNGGIYYWPDTGAIDLRDAVVTYVGLHCFGETDWDQGPGGADEPYVILSATGPKTAQTVRTRIYDDDGGVDAGDYRNDQIELYRGRPYGINLSAILMEYDFGDPERYRQQVQEVVDGVHKLGTTALGLIPVVGPVIAGIVGPALGSLMPAIGESVNGLFDWGDDRIGGSTVTLPAREMVLLTARNQERAFQGIAYEIESDLISGLGASYKVYFTLSPART